MQSVQIRNWALNLIIKKKREQNELVAIAEVSKSVGFYCYTTKKVSSLKKGKKPKP